MGREGKEEEGGERGRMIKVCVCEWVEWRGGE